MEIWIGKLFSQEVIRVIPAIALIIIGLIVERKYSGRIAIFSNFVALSTFFSQYENVHPLIILYINLLTIFGFIAILSYAFRRSLPKEFYQIAGIFSSVVSGIVLLLGLIIL